MTAASPDGNVPIQVGEVLAGKYRVERVLGTGAMGVVVAARHVDLHELRAIKFMLPAALGDAAGVERFLREARAAAQLKSQHVAKVHDFGRLDSGAPYIVMEHLEGADLKSLLDARGSLPVGEAVGYLLQVCEAVAEAHAAGIVHRDLKPANLFLTTVAGRPCLKVLDFGIAKLSAPAGAGAVEMTATASFFGTPLYMSPEQMRSARAVDPRSDIWSLGVLLYRMLTGKTPFSGSSVTELCAAVVADAPEPPSAARPDLPPALEAVIFRCLAKNPAERFQNVSELAAAIAPFAAGGAPLPAPYSQHAPSAVAHAVTTHPASAHPHDVHAAPAYPVQSAHAPTMASKAAPPAPARRSRAPWIVAGVLGVLAAAGGVAAFVVLSSPGDDHEPAASRRPTASPTATVGALPAARTTWAPSTARLPAAQPGGPRPAAGSPGAGATPTPYGTATPDAGATAPAPATTSSSGSAALQGIVLGCWRDNEGAAKGQAASSASVQVSAGPPRSVVVTGPAKAQKSFTSCVVTRGASLPLGPGETAQASVSLPAGPS